MKTPRIEALEARLKAIGRPSLPLASLRELTMGRAAQRAWDAAHPDGAAEHFALTADLDAAVREAEALEQQLRVAEKALRRLEASGVGPRSLDAASAPDETPAIAAVRRWLGDSSRTWLVLCGSKGTGKSVAATWAVREVCRQGSSAAFRSMASLAKLSSFDAGADEMAYLKRVHLLVLDDVGTEVLTDHAKAQLHDLLDARHEHYGRTIVTSNLLWDAPLAPGSLQERLGERLVDRVRQSGGVVQFKGPSLRKAAP